ncbi:hypothetical protein WMY93_013356 [Mugilogobius chulae]|uniref:Uncharacterized protein n=1 Tax=Mugilogobius chulae TaxID=88201 RepID=A0AAW0NZ89_9GOBI
MRKAGDGLFRSEARAPEAAEAHAPRARGQRAAVGHALRGGGVVAQDNRSVILENISEELRSLLPQDAMFPSESFCRRQMEACARRTVHVDGFLFDENLLDSMCEDGTFSRNFCLQCGSSRTRELVRTGSRPEFLSHSFSVPELRFLFLNVLPDLSGLVLVDVGSRLGAVLYAGHIFSSAQSLIGVELNQDFVKLQNQIVHKYGFEDRSKPPVSFSGLNRGLNRCSRLALWGRWFHADVCSQGGFGQKSAMFCGLHNVFGFFRWREDKIRFRPDPWGVGLAAGLQPANRLKTRPTR